jgi:hypothetical protein
VPDWLEKSQKRPCEIEEGVDADLVQANRKRFKIAFVLLGIASALGLVNITLHVPGTAHLVLRTGAIASGIVGVAMAKWAQDEQAFSARADSNDRHQPL